MAPLALWLARAQRAALALVVLALLVAAPASAEPGFEYEEAHRFGGFDESAYNHGRFGGSLTPGRFVDPTGFAVDPVNNTVYVVDRTSSAEANPTEWRIQELEPEADGTGARLLGTTKFTLPNEPSKGFGSIADASAIEGLAIDHNAGRLYALVVGPPPPLSPYSEPPFSVAQELLAWRTAPNGRGELEAAPGLESDSVLHTTGALVSSERQLLSGATPLYGPEGIAVDPIKAIGVDNPIAIEASDLAAGVGRGSPTIGDTIVQQVATQQQGATATGDLLKIWSGASVAGALGEHEGPHGISTSPDGTLTVLLDSDGINDATETYVVELKADLSKATLLDNGGNVPPLGDSDQSPMDGNESPFSGRAGSGISSQSGAGPQTVQLSAAPGRSGLYAGVTFAHEGSDFQTSSIGPPGPEYWTSGEHAGEEFEANIGVRLLAPEADGTISNLQGRTIVNTLGGSGDRNCHISAPRAALAAGSGGTLWILDRGPSTTAPGANGQGREVIELAPRAPGSERLCPQPSGTFTITPAGGQAESAEETFSKEPLTISAGTQVTFSATKREAGKLEVVGGKPFAYEWDLDGNPTNGPAGDGFEKVYEMQPIHYYFPPSSVTYMFTRPGEYHVRFRMRTDYGVYTPPHPGILIVTKDPIHPEASFSATPSGGQQVTFNATGSTPGVGKIVNYHWSWGDGGEEDEDPQTPVVAHTYAQPGNYQVTLTVTNSAYQSVTSAPQTVTVVAPPPPLAAAASLTGLLYDIPPPFALYPVPPTTADRAPTRLAPHTRFAGGALSVTLACPAAKQLCAGTVSVETVAAYASSAKTGKSRHKASRVLLGRAAFSVPGGQSRTVKVRLSAKGMSLLKREKRLKVLVIVAAHDSFGDPGATTLGLTLNASIAHGHGSSGHTSHRRR